MRRLWESIYISRQHFYCHRKSCEFFTSLSHSRPHKSVILWLIYWVGASENAQYTNLTLCIWNKSGARKRVVIIVCRIRVKQNRIVFAIIAGNIFGGPMESRASALLSKGIGTSEARTHELRAAIRRQCKQIIIIINPGLIGTASEVRLAMRKTNEVVHNFRFVFNAISVTAVNRCSYSFSRCMLLG